MIEDDIASGSHGSGRRTEASSGLYRMTWQSRHGMSSRRTQYTSSSGQSDPNKLNVPRLDSMYRHKRHSYHADWFKFPKALHVWDQEQHPHVVDWADLFYDLIYVGVAFKTGNLLSVKDKAGFYSINTDAFGLFFCIILPFYGGWESRLEIRSKYV